MSRRTSQNWPQAWGIDGEIRDVHKVEQCVVLRNHPNWKMILASPESLIDTVWRSTPFEVWSGIIGEVVDGHRHHPPDPLRADFEVGADRYQFEEEEEKEWEIHELGKDRIYHSIDGNSSCITRVGSSGHDFITGVQM